MSIEVMHVYFTQMHLMPGQQQSQPGHPAKKKGSQIEQNLK